LIFGYHFVIITSNLYLQYLVDIFPDYQIEPQLDLVIKLSATEMSNEQHKQINEMISYINEGNYFGDTYRQYLINRRDANDFWISTFYPISTKDLAEARCQRLAQGQTTLKSATS
jgi:hypothetical protein